ncbi:hypothetical protein LINGRAHAP2_LOCUS3026 [Linum grandiflorum]
MAALRPLTREQIANTEKKLDMPLGMYPSSTFNSASSMSSSPPLLFDFDHSWFVLAPLCSDAIIKLSKTASTAKPNKQSRVPNKNQKVFNNHVQGKAFKGALAQKRSNFQGSHFPIAKDFARKAAVVPLRNSNRPFNNNAMPNANKARILLLLPTMSYCLGICSCYLCQFCLSIWNHGHVSDHKFPVDKEIPFLMSRCRVGHVMHQILLPFGLGQPGRAPQQQQQQQGDGGIKPRIQTLDAMFANMKEQRTRASLQQQQNNGVRHNNWGQHRNPNFSRRGVPWARNRFAN